MLQVSHYTDKRGAFRVACCRSEATEVAFRSAGGGYDGANREWVFPPSSIGRAMAAMHDLFGSAEEAVRVEVRSRYATSGEARYRGWDDGREVVLGGYVLASRRERDFHVEIVERLCAGVIPARGGSVNKPRVSPSSDAVFSLDVRRDFAEANGLAFVPSEASHDCALADAGGFAYPAGKYLLELALPAGDPHQAAEMVRALVSAMSDQEILGSLRAR